jgi:citrate synthase
MGKGQLSSLSVIKTGPRARILQQWGNTAVENSIIDSSLYTKYDVKRGLREISGKGVLAGLTKIGEISAYTTDDKGQPIPQPGELIYRGIDINHLVEGFSSEGRLGFEETSFLLLFGRLPKKEELELFSHLLASKRRFPPGFVQSAILDMPGQDMMNAMSRGVLALYTYDKNADDTAIPNVLKQSLNLIAAFPLLAVYAYQAYLRRYKNGSMVIHRPQKRLSTAENILHMLRPDSSYTRTEARLLDLALVLHAEHGGGNNSSFTTHVVSSSGTDTYSAIVAALASLKGPKHGGANVKSVDMLDNIKENVRDWKDDNEIERHLERILRKEAFDRSGLIYGVGHAVYSVSDPRAEILRIHARDLAKEKGLAEEFQLFTRVEELAPKVIGRVRKMYKGVCANVDFYSGFIYKMLGIPEELNTPLFAIARIVGWSAHRIEELANGGKIIRPAYRSVSDRGVYVPMEER